MPCSVGKFPRIVLVLRGRVDLYRNRKSFVSVMSSEGLDKIIFKALPSKKEKTKQMFDAIFLPKHILRYGGGGMDFYPQNDFGI